MLALLGCSGGSDAIVEPDPGIVASVTLSESAISLESGFSRQLTAILKSASGNVISTASVEWSSDNPSVATAYGGNIEGHSAGSTFITASSSGKQARASVTVTPAIVTSIELSRSAATLAPGQTLQLNARALDARQRPIEGRSISFSSSAESAASVTQSGIVTAVAPATVVITASAGDAVGTLVVNVVTRKHIAIASIASSAAAEPIGYDVKIRHPDDSISAYRTWGSAGVIDGMMTLPDSVDVIASASGGQFWPSRAKSTGVSLPASLPVVFIPLNYTLKSGAFAGTTHPMNLNAAFARCPLQADACMNGFFGRTFRTGIKGWATYPIQVVIMPGIDSATVWDGLHAMEDKLGRQIFTPAVLAQGPHILVQPGLPPGINDPIIGGYAQWNWDERDRITGATVWFKSALNRQIIQHEFTHALGFGHTCSWSSIMGGYGCSTPFEMTATDAAYILLALDVHRLEQPLRTTSGPLACGTMSLAAAVNSEPYVLPCSQPALKLERNRESRQSAMP